VFNFALHRVPQSIQETLNAAKKSIDDLDYLVLHQANGLITKTLARKLGVPLARCLTSIEEFGNTSSASIPLTLACHGDELYGRKELSLILSGFGVGFSWASLFFSTDFPKTKLITYA
jgi:3-oxoacyl-[acyl-carrier-protein] synthase-3